MKGRELEVRHVVDGEVGGRSMVGLYDLDAEQRFMFDEVQAGLLTAMRREKARKDGVAVEACLAKLKELHPNLF